MKILALGLTVPLLLIWPGTGDLMVAPDRTAAQQGGTTPERTTPGQIEAQDPLRDNYERKRAGFSSGRELLMRKSVPFDPDILLEDDWRERVRPFLGQMAQMSRVRRMSNNLKGAHLGDTIYLPEKIELTGDTVIMARRLVFEGQHILIKGPHNIYVYVIESEEISGVREESLARKGSPRFANAGFTEPDVPQSNEDLSITIDVSGFGHKESLEQQAAARAARTPGGIQFVKPGYRALSLAQTPAKGSPGSQGTDGAPATPGAQANPLLRSKGPDGVCGTSVTVNGGTGQGGGHGGDAGNGNTNELRALK